MTAATLPADELERRLKAVAQHSGNVAAAAASLNLSRSTLQNTVRVARSQGKEIYTLPKGAQKPPLGLVGHDGRVDFNMKDGVILVGSDAHIWPGAPTPGMRAFLWAIDFFRESLRAVVVNGDMFDGASISRFARMNWEKIPTVSEELASVQAQLREIRSRAPEECQFFWPIGNYDQRYEAKLANTVPEYQNVRGIHLKDHFGEYWKACWSLWVHGAPGEPPAVITHRWKGGVHSVHNNAKDAGVTIVTGHDHALRVSPWSDYRGHRWGVSTGMLATPYSTPFVHYTEGNPVNWRVGFAVLTWRDGRLSWPELVHVIDDDRIDFRGEVRKIA